MKSRQVPFFLYWRVENVQFWINSIGHLGWLSCISNFPRFHKNVNSLELWRYISENSSPKGSFWRNKKKSEFSELSWDSPYLLAVALKTFYQTTFILVFFRWDWYAIQHPFIHSQGNIPNQAAISDVSKRKMKQEKRSKMKKEKTTHGSHEFQKMWELPIPEISLRHLPHNVLSARSATVKLYLKQIRSWPQTHGM